MGGVGLSRLWSSNPRLAFVLHLLVTLMVGGFALSSTFSGADWKVALVLVVGFVLMAATLIFFTWSAIQDHWQPDTYAYSDAQPLPSPRAAWASAKALERVMWLLFALAFLGGFVLAAAKIYAGLVMVVLSLPIAVVAMRAGR